MIISKLDRTEYEGKKFELKYFTNGYYDIENVDDGQLLGYVEGTIEQWNNRYRVSNICVFSSEKRHCGIGTELMKTIMKEAKNSGARMVVLETQTCNENAISFYKKNGFEIIGFDLFAYTNEDPKRHEIRIEMGKIL